MYGVKIKKNLKSKSYQLYIASQYICSIKEIDLIDYYEDYLEDPMNPEGIMVTVLNKIDEVEKKPGYIIDIYGTVKLVRQEVIEKISELFETVNTKKDNEI